ncbi:MAG: hypothetical protein AAF386_05670 [Pseudomonadota bacterium]
MIKDGHPGAMELLGYRADAAVTVVDLTVTPAAPKIGQKAEISVTLRAQQDEPVIVDYVMHLRKANGTLAPKVFKMKDIILKAGAEVTVSKKHLFKGDATTFTLYPGPQSISVQVNGQILGQVAFMLEPDN